MLFSQPWKTALSGFLCFSGLPFPPLHKVPHASCLHLKQLDWERRDKLCHRWTLSFFSVAFRRGYEDVHRALSNPPAVV